MAGALLKVEGINVNAENEKGWTPLNIAAINSYKEIAVALLAKGADVNAKNENGWALMNSYTSAYVAWLAREKEQKQAEKMQERKEFLQVVQLHY